MASPAAVASIRLVARFLCGVADICPLAVNKFGKAERSLESTRVAQQGLAGYKPVAIGHRHPVVGSYA
ncbi:hypothetical protein GCM10010393_14180 [Streptomyces gobitricini]|uniref:Uncharacterized protein n=1 Tax=Streptomyces gobitricini TaxID=68211 RepID=A0ABN3LI97_9ACTN